MQYRETPDGSVESTVLDSFVLEDAGKLTDPVLSAFDAAWRSKAKGDRLPGRQHIEPTAVAGLLPHVMLLDVVEGSLGTRFRARLVGQHHVGMVGRNAAGEYIGEEAFKTVALSGRPHYSRHHVAEGPSGAYTFERVVYPLATNGSDVDRLAVVAVPPYPSTARAASFSSWF